MDYLGTCDLSNNELKNLLDLRSQIYISSATLVWFEKQSFFNPLIKQEIELMLKEWQKKADEVISLIKIKVKQEFPNGKKMAISYRRNEVKVYG